MANNLLRSKQVAVVSALVEGCSMRSTMRMTGVDRQTIGTLLARVGEGCDILLDQKMRNLSCKRLELDELWAFVAKKQRHVLDEEGESEVGDIWTYLATDAETKLVPSYYVGKRTEQNTRIFIEDLAFRLREKVQISTDGLRSYIDAIGTSFGGVVDYAQVIKSYEAEPMGSGRYSPPKVIEVTKLPIFGAPVEEFVSTSYAERNNLNVRMGVRRYTRLTNAFSKKLEMHMAATALHFAHYNFVRIHKTLRTTPAMAAGVANTLWSVEELLEAALVAA